METLQLALGGLALSVWILSRLARRLPHVTWLQPFADAFPQLARPWVKARVKREDAFAAAPGLPHKPPAQSRPSAVDLVLMERAARGRRRGAVYAGVQLILLGLGLPLAYAALDTMLFSTMTRTEVMLVGAASLLCIGLGVTAIWSSRRHAVREPT